MKEMSKAHETDLARMRHLSGLSSVCTLRIGGKKFEIERIAQPDRLLDRMTQADFSPDERLPYWAELWPSALALTEFILESPAEFNSRQVVDLGCGLGLTGIGATVAGADVLFTDYEKLSLIYTRRNFKRNFNRRARVKLMDWREPDIPRETDILIAADVLYENRWLDAIERLIRLKLKPGMSFYIAEPGRSIAAGFFSRICNDRLQDRTMLKKVILDNKLYYVHIHKLTYAGSITIRS